MSNKSCWFLSHTHEIIRSGTKDLPNYYSETIEKPFNDLINSIEAEKRQLQRELEKREKQLELLKKDELTIKKWSYRHYPEDKEETLCIQFPDITPKQFLEDMSVPKDLETITISKEDFLKLV